MQQTKPPSRRYRDSLPISPPTLTKDPSQGADPCTPLALSSSPTEIQVRLLAWCSAEKVLLAVRALPPSRASDKPQELLHLAPHRLAPSSSSSKPELARNQGSLLTPLPTSLSKP